MDLARALHRVLDMDGEREMELAAHLDGETEMDGAGLIKIHQVEEENRDLEMIYGRIEMDLGVALHQVGRLD